MYSSSYSGLSILTFLLFQFTSCSWRPASEEYRMQYTYLEEKIQKGSFAGSDYYIVFLVDSKHFDYSDSYTFLNTFVKHPDSASKECTVGHAWILLKGLDALGNPIVIEGGHSGELGIEVPRYMDGIFSLIQAQDLNPIKYLWEPLNDGFFQKGNGGHTPTCAAKVNLKKEQFEDVLNFIHPEVYPYKKYSLTARQCVTFLTQIAALLDLNISSETSLPIKQSIIISKKKYILWTDPCYSLVTFSSPERLEHSLIKLLQKGKAECALEWYCAFSTKNKEHFLKKVQLLPFRIKRYLLVK